MSRSSFVGALFPLQIGDASFFILGAIALGIIILITIVALQKRTSAMSDDLSKQSRARFEALVPNLPDHAKAAEESHKSQEEAVKTPTLAPSRVDRTGYSSLSNGVVDLKSCLDNLILENHKRLEEAQQTRATLEEIRSQINGLGNRVTENEKITAEVRSLKMRMSPPDEEFQKLRTILDEQNVKLDQIHFSNDEMRTRLESRLDTLFSDSNKHFEGVQATQANFEKTISEISGNISQVEKLTREVQTLKEGFLTDQEELRRLRTSLDVQSLKLEQLNLSSGQTNARMDSTTSFIGTRQSTVNTGSLQASRASTSLVRCIYCGAVLENRDRFCNKCGKPAT